MLVSLAGAPSMFAQMPMKDDMAGMDHGDDRVRQGEIGNRQRDQGHAAARRDSSAAASAGFQPVFGWIPTMGVHWVDRSRMVKAKQSDITAPDNLMFSKIGGKDSLVGAA